MFSTFQGGPFVEVFTPQGKDPTEGWKMLGGKCVKRMYEKGVKGYVHHVTGPPGLKMQLPADERRGLGLKQPYLVFQMLLPSGQYVSLEIVVADHEGTRRRLILSTSFTDVKSTPLHAQVPLPNALVPYDRWVNLALDLPSLTRALWAEQRAEFKSVEGVGVGATCAIRKIFTAKSPPQEHGVDPSVQREAARIKDTMTEGGRAAVGTDGSLGIRGFGCGPGDASRSRTGAFFGGESTQFSQTEPAPEPVPRAADFLPGVERTTVCLDPAKLMACRVAGLPNADVYVYDGGGSPKRASSREGCVDERFGGLGVAGLRIGGGGGGNTPGGGGHHHHHHHLSYSAPSSGRKHTHADRVSSRGASRDGVHLAFGTRVSSTPPSRGRSRPASQPEHNRRWSPTNGNGNGGVHSRDGTPGTSGRTRAERFNEDLASYFAAQGHGRSSGFIDRLNRRNSVDNNGGGGPGAIDLPHVDARPKVSSPGGKPGGLISHGSREWDDDVAALGDLGGHLSVSPKGGASGRRSVTFGASPKTPGGARRTQANAQPRAHTVGGASPRSRGSRLSTGALPALSPRERERSSSRGLDFGPSLRSREGGGLDECDLGGSMRVSSLSHSFDAGGEGGVVNHFPARRRSQRSSGIGSPSGSLNASSGSVSDGGDEESATAVAGAGSFMPQPPPGAYSSRRYADDRFENRFDPGFDDDDMPNMRHSELGLSNSSLDRFVGGNAAPPRLVVPGGPEDDDAVVVTVEPPTRSIASPMHPHGFGGYDDDFQLAADLNSPSAGLDGRPGRRTYGGRGRGARGGRGSVERTIQTPSKLHGAPRAARGGEADGVEKEGEDGGGVYMDGEGPGANAARGNPSTTVIRASRAASEVGDEDPAVGGAEGGADLNDDDDDDRGIEPIAETLEPHRDSNGIAYYPNGSAPTRDGDDDDGLGLSSDDESGQLRMMRESQIIGVSDMPSRGGHSRGADSSTSGDGGWGGIGGAGGWSSRPGTGSSSIWGKQTNSRGFSTPAGLRLFTPDLILSGGERRSTVPPPMGAHDVTGGGTRTTSDAANAKEPPVTNGSKEPLHVVNGEANVARAGPIGNSKPNSPSFAGKNEIKSEGENKEEPAELDLIYDPVLNYYFDPKSNTYYELKT